MGGWLGFGAEGSTVRITFRFAHPAYGLPATPNSSCPGRKYIKTCVQQL
jgi:hypothetical protein